MTKHFLVTVSEQRGALYGVKYLGHFFTNKADIKITLFYTAPKPSGLGGGESTREAKTRQKKQTAEYMDKGKQALDAAEEELCQMGFTSEQIDAKLQSRRISKIADIMNEGSAGRYDAVILGKRGLSWLEEQFDESVSKGFLETEFHFPVWFCRHPDLERKNVLVGIDGSDASYRMADHIGFIMSGEKSHNLTLLMIKKGDIKENQIENIFSKTKVHLSGNGFPAELIKTQVIEANDVAKAIIKEANKGKYATVALGRTGTGKGFIDRLFMGSVSEAVFKSLDHAALWLCY